MRDDRALVFIHIPKTAGSTFSTMLRNNFDENEMKFIEWADQIGGTYSCYDVDSSVKLIYGHQPIGLNRYLHGDSIVVTFLRDPLKRTLSHYFFLNLKRKQDALEIPLEFIYSQGPEIDWNGMPYFWLFDNFQTRWLSNAIFGVQYKNMTDMLSAAIENLQFMHIGLTEQFDDSLEYFSKIYNFTSLEYTNETVNDKKPTQEISDDLSNLIHSHNKYDNVLYEFCKLKFSDQLSKYR